MDIYGQALADYFNGRSDDTLWLNNSYGEPEEMPVEVFFREMDDMPEIEILAMEKCHGKILDIGAGAGSHSLILQPTLEVTALEISEIACNLMTQRGVNRILNQNYFGYSGEKFDTLLLLMNGIGVSGDLEGFRFFLDHSKTLLNEGGQIIFDSSDISYLYEDGLPKPANYFGEISYQYEYKGVKGDWFNWLYLDQETLKTEAERNGWRARILLEDDYDQFLVQLTLANE